MQNHEFQRSTLLPDTLNSCNYKLSHETDLELLSNFRTVRKLKPLYTEIRINYFYLGDKTTPNERRILLTDTQQQKSHA